MRFIDLATMKEAYHFSLDDLIQKGLINEQFSITGPDPRGWTKDSRYLWGDVSVGAEVFYFFRVDATNWNIDIFEIPEDVFGGTALNIEKGYITRYPDYVWTGVHELTEQIKREWREQGKVSSLYLYNLFSKDDILLATTSDPLWDFKDKWLSDTELEYEMPSGEKRVYVIGE